MSAPRTTAEDQIVRHLYIKCPMIPRNQDPAFGVKTW